MARIASTSSLRPNRRIVTWNGCGAPPGASAIASPSRISSRTGSGRTAATISGTAAVTSLRLRVNTRTSSPALWTCTRAPSSFQSTAAVPRKSSAFETLSADCASIGCTGWRRRMPNCAMPPAPSTSAARAMAGRPPAYIAARRTSSGGSAAACAIASSITPSSAPWRSSPTRSRTRNSCSSRVARAKSSPSWRARSAAEPLPFVVASAASASSTARSSSDAFRAPPERAPASAA